MRLDVLHRENLETVIERFGIDPREIPEDVLDKVNLCWHRLDPWPDAVAGLARLKQRHIIAPLSNANVRLALDVAKPRRAAMGRHPRREVAAAYKLDPGRLSAHGRDPRLSPEQV